MSSERKRGYVPGPKIRPHPTTRVLYGFSREHPKGVSLKTRDRAEAEKRFAELLAGRREPGRMDGAAQEARLSAVADAYLAAPHGWTKQTKRTAKNRVLAFGIWAAGKGIAFPAQVTPQLLDTWLVERRGAVAQKTINRDLRPLKLMFEWAVARGLALPNAAVAGRAYYKEPKREDRHVVPDPQEMVAILARVDTFEAEMKARRAEQKKARKAAKPGRGSSLFGREPRYDARFPLEALYVTGLRIDELRRLGPEHVVDGVLHAAPEEGPADQAEPTKGYRERKIPLAPSAQRVLARFFAWTSKRKRTFSESWLNGRFGDACEALKIDRAGLHDIRRGFATEQVRRGVDVVVVSKWLGHADIATTERYLAHYRSDAAIVAHVPGGEVVIAPAEQASPAAKHASPDSASPAPTAAVPGVGAPGVENPKASDSCGDLGPIREIPAEHPASGAEAKALESRSYPSDLNRRPAVYETASDDGKDSSSPANNPKPSDSGPTAAEVGRAGEGLLWAWGDAELAREVEAQGWN